MDYPAYPANLARIEYAAGDLFEAHETAVAAFATIVRTARAAIAKLDFPLGSPARGYDLADIDRAMEDWLTPRRYQDLEDAALDIAREAA